MRLEEIATIKSKNNAAIVAPAGHGKNRDDCGSHSGI